MDESSVGRASERAVVADALARARVGRPVPLLITGEPGIGKSTLLADAVAEAARQGFRTVVVAADRVDAGVPLSALRLAFEEPLADERDPSLRDVAAVLHDALARRAASAEVHDVAPLLQRLVGGWAFHAPVLIGIDDLHHADDATSALVLQLMREVRHHRVITVTTTRGLPTLDPPVARSLAAMRDQGSLRVLELGALDDDDLAELVRRRIGRPPSARFVSLLAARSGGTPLFAIELIHAMARSDDLVERDGLVDAVAREQPVLPARLSTTVLHRVFELGPHARDVDRAAAVLATIPHGAGGILADVAAMGADDAAAGFADLVAAGVLVADDRGHRFAHALVRDAVYDDLGPAARRRLHGRAAAAMTGPGPWPAAEVVDVARHVLASAAGHDTTAVAALVAAGDSLADDAPLAAARWYRAALAHMAPTDGAVVAVQLALSRVLDLAGAHDEAARIAIAAGATARGADERDAAVTGAARALLNGGRRERALELLDAAAADPLRRTPAVLLHLAEAVAWTDRQHELPGLLAAARTSGDEQVRDAVDALDVFALLADGRFAAAAEHARRLRAATHVAAPARRPLLRLATCAASAFDLEPADAIAIADELPPSGPMAGLVAACAAWARYRTGAFGDVERLGTAILDASGGPDGSVEHGLWLAALVASRVERADPAAGALVAAVERTAASPPFETGLDLGRAMWRRAGADLDGAAAILEGAVRREERRGQVNVLALALAAAVETAAERGDGDSARRHNERLQDLAGDAGDAGVAVTMCCLHAQAIAHGDVDAAAASRDHALRHALAADAGRALGLVGTLRGDAAVLEAAYRELGAIGAVRRQRVVAFELRRIGHRVPHSPAGGEAFSPVEVELVGLVTAGLTNRAVAERMGLSSKTVEVYLSRIYRKTGLRSRVELAVAAHDGRLGHLPDV